ncbi:MAG: tetratricopeptide repeat protein [Crocinitomicaceae bacterium]|nr:tetratricopeptide repeat protein [Crocinitomicaceae bacterium]
MKIIKTALVALCCQLFSLVGFCQSTKLDSLLYDLLVFKNDTNEVNTLHLLAEYSYKDLQDFDTAIFYVTNALNLSERLNFKKGVAKSHKIFGNIYNAKNEYEQALRHYEISLEKEKAAKNISGMASLHINIGNVFSKLGDYDASLQNYERALELKKVLGDYNDIGAALCKIGSVYINQGNYLEALKNILEASKCYDKTGDIKGKATVHNYLGIIYSLQLNYNEALTHYLAALKINQDLEDDKAIAMCYHNIGLIYGLIGNYSESLVYLFEALRLKKEQGNANRVADTYIGIADTYSKIADYEKSLEYNFMALAILEKSGYKERIAGTCTNVGQVYLQLKQFSKSKTWYKKGLDLSIEIGVNLSIKNCYLGLSKVDSALGNYKDAYNNYKMYIVYRDSLISDENTKKTVEMHMQYEFDKKQAADSIANVQQLELKNVELAKQQAEISAKRNQQYFLFGGLVLVLIFSSFIYNRFRVTQKQKNVIQLKEKETALQKTIIEEKHKEITDSINYAERIQRSFLATDNFLNDNFSQNSADNYFVFFQPKDVVSGDFYWASRTQNNLLTLVVADSTGHGVPGAIMSILNISSLEKSIDRMLNQPAEIFNHTRQIIVDRLKNDGSENGGHDGMDASIICIDKLNHLMHYAAANNPIWLIRNEELQELAYDKMPIGKHDLASVSFKENILKIERGDKIYMLTDGYGDQFGGEKGKKFMNKRLKEYILTISHLPMSNQKQRLKKKFEDWKTFRDSNGSLTDLEQIDDVCVVGLEIGSLIYST